MQKLPHRGSSTTPACESQFVLKPTIRRSLSHMVFPCIRCWEDHICTVIYSIYIYTYVYTPYGSKPLIQTFFSRLIYGYRLWIYWQHINNSYTDRPFTMDFPPGLAQVASYGRSLVPDSTATRGTATSGGWTKCLEAVMISQWLSLAEGRIFKSGWWFGCHQFGILSRKKKWEFHHHPNWRTHIFQRGGHQPEILMR